MITLYPPRCYVLHCVAEYDRIPVCLWGYKGGRCDRHERAVANRRGGSTENPQKSVYDSQIFARRTYSRRQVRGWEMAGERIRCGNVHQLADLPQTRGNKLTLSVAHSQQRSSHATMLQAVMHYLAVYFTTIDSKVQESGETMKRNAKAITIEEAGNVA
jgi:hypothetical protein